MAAAIYTDALLRKVLSEVRTIAMVGASANPERPSFGVMEYLQRHGYQVIPVNPGLAGKDLLGSKVFGRLTDIPVPVDMVDIFRNSIDAGGIVDEALALPHLPSVIWMQIGVINTESAARAEARGVTVIMDHCPKIEHARLIV